MGILNLVRDEEQTGTPEMEMKSKFIMKRGNKFQINLLPNIKLVAYYYNVYTDNYRLTVLHKGEGIYLGSAVITNQ
eukprot:10878106-Ditylum_brightwellii.AAC.1